MEVDNKAIAELIIRGQLEHYNLLFIRSTEAYAYSVQRKEEATKIVIQEALKQDAMREDKVKMEKYINYLKNKLAELQE